MPNHKTAPLWIKLAGLAVLAIMSFGLAAAALVAPTPTSTYVLSPSSTAPATTEAPDPTTALFIGDSYTQGKGASADSLRWTSLVSAALGWNEVNKGRGGTGYLGTSGPAGCGLSYCPNYSEMLDDSVGTSPDIVVIAGGQNDLSAYSTDPDDVTGTITAVYTTARELYPDARIVAIGPSDPWGAGDLTRSMDEVVQGAAASIEAEYVSMVDPNVLADPSLILEDGAHANDAGHRAIADRVLASIGS